MDSSCGTSDWKQEFSKCREWKMGRRSGCLLAIDFLAMADAKDKNDQAVVFDRADEPIIAYTVFPELSKPRAVQRLSDAARIQFGDSLMQELQDALGLRRVEFAEFPLR